MKLGGTNHLGGSLLCMSDRKLLGRSCLHDLHFNPCITLSKVLAPNFDTVNSLQSCRADPLRWGSSYAMTRHTTQSHNPDTDLSCPCRCHSHARHLTRWRRHGSIWHGIRPWLDLSWDWSPDRPQGKGRAGRIGRVQDSCVEGWQFNARSSQSNDFNTFIPLGIHRIGKGLTNLGSGWGARVGFQVMVFEAWIPNGAAL